MNLLAAAGVVLLGMLAALVFTAVGVRRRPRRASETAPETPAPVAPAPWEEQSARDLGIAVLTFDGVVGAERAFASVRDNAGADPWQLEIAFVEHHHRGRIVVRGTFAGRYLDVEDVGGRLFDEIRADVPESSSALIVFAPSDDVEAMLDAFRESGATVTRHQVSAADAAAFEASVAQAPPAVR
jgi:hypothetical protein